MDIEKSKNKKTNNKKTGITSVALVRFDFGVIIGCKISKCPKSPGFVFKFTENKLVLTNFLVLIWKKKTYWVFFQHQIAPKPFAELKAK